MFESGFGKIAGTAVVIGLAVSGLASGANAAGEDPLLANGSAMFRAMDWNRDGTVAGAEAYTAGAWLFASLDRNKDGYISASETSTPPGQLVSYVTPSQSERVAEYMRIAFRYMDSDGDGWVSNPEFHGFGSYIFRTADRNRNGSLTMSELKPVLSQLTGTAAETRLSRFDR